MLKPTIFTLGNVYSTKVHEIEKYVKQILPINISMLTMSTGRDKEARYLQVLSSKGLKLGATENQIQLAIWVGPELAALFIF